MTVAYIAIAENIKGDKMLIFELEKVMYIETSVAGWAMFPLTINTFRELMVNEGIFLT